MVIISENKKFKVLLVESRPQEAYFIKENFERKDANSYVCVVNNCAEALEFLQKKGQYSGRKRPDLILLDTGTAKREGHEFIDTIKHDSILKTIPVIVLTDSDENQDISMSYILQANAHILKPVEIEKFQQVLMQIQNFWLHTAALA